MATHMKLLYAGTPEIAVAPLKSLLDAGQTIAAVISQPDRPVGRKQILTPPPVARFAKENNLPLLQPESAKDPTFLETLRGLKPDLIIIVAYGQILPQSFLDIPQHGCWNIHFSLLPKYRGAAPLQWALINGESETGITLQQVALKLDAGPVLLQEKLSVLPGDDTESLGKRLSAASGSLLLEGLKQLRAGVLKSHPQDENAVSWAPSLIKEAGRINWNQPAKKIADQIRGVTPWPGAFTFYQTQRIKIFPPVEMIETPIPKTPGAILQADASGLVIQCGMQALQIKELQREGSRRLPAAEFLKGYPVPIIILGP